MCRVREKTMSESMRYAAHLASVENTSLWMSLEERGSRG